MSGAPSPNRPQMDNLGPRPKAPGQPRLIPSAGRPKIPIMRPLDARLPQLAQSTPVDAISSVLRARRPRRTFMRWRIVFLGLAFIVFVFGIGIFFYLLKSNKKVLDEIHQVGSAAQADAQSITGVGADEVIVPDETPPKPHVYTEYVVPSDEPRYLTINRFGQKARVLKLGLLKNGNLDVPRSIYDAGWYSATSKPGQAGATLIIGHSTGPTKQGIFGKLGQLVAGDTVAIERGDGQKFQYKVVTKKTFPTKSVDMASALVPITPGKPGLNLMTCAGDYAGVREGYKERVIVYMEQI